MFVMIAVIFFTGFVPLYAQYESSSPSIPKQEYFNPAYSAYKTYGSFDAMFRQQWLNSRANTPEMFAANIFIPTQRQGLGFGGTFVVENIGLRTINTFTVNMSQGLQIDKSTYLAVGLGLGYEFASYNQSKMIAYPEVDFTRVKMNQSHPVISLGFMALMRYYFFGASSNLRLNKYDFDFKYLTGFDAFFGRIVMLNYDYVFRTTIVGKYYKQTRYNISNESVESEFVPPVIDWTISCLMYEQLWLSFGCRFGQAVTTMANYRISNQLNVGVKYEIGVGTGYNQYNSQGVYLTYNFGRKRHKKYRGYNFYKGVFVRGSRLRNPVNEYLY